ncbi:MAG: thioredoxin family protein [Methylomonas sp.]|nr:thioredoxin family protein [Methylomonas sp.]
MIRKLASITLLWLFGIVIAQAEIPKASLNVTLLTPAKWPAEYKLTLSVPKDHHAYLDKGDEKAYLPIEIDAKGKLAASRLTLGDLQKPAGERDDVAKALVLRNQGDFRFTLKPLGKEALTVNTTVLDVSYQLCNDIKHVCFRPQTAQIELTLPTAGTGASLDTSSITDGLLSLFKNNQDNTFIIFGLMFIAGILSVATPCVYPMLPITSMFVANRANGVTEKVKLHALAYMVGIIGTYMLLGLIAGMTGGAFNAFMQSAWVNIGFALFFSFFAIALLGFYELAFMQNEVHTLEQRTYHVNGLAGTWLMGSVAGLVISPCVGPIVFALLLQVADLIADEANALALTGQSLTVWDKLRISSQGSLMMGGFGLGVSLPFFTISVVKFKKLPKSGYWMNKIKYAFGLMILYFAYVYFAKGMGVLGVEHSVTQSLAFGIVAIWMAVVYFNVLSLVSADAQPNQKMHHFCGVMLLIIGAWLVVAGLGQTPIINTAHANTIAAESCQNPASSAIQEDAGIPWYRNFDAAQKVAQQTGKPIFIDFYASWCANCVAFKEETANNPRLNQALREKAVAVKLVDQEPEFEKFRNHPEHRQLKIGLPYFSILSPDGKLIWSSTDYQATEEMVNVLANFSG